MQTLKYFCQAFGNILVLKGRYKLDVLKYQEDISTLCNENTPVFKHTKHLPVASMFYLIAYKTTM